MGNKVAYFKRVPAGSMGANCYILSGGEGRAVLIDPGGNYERLQSVLTENGLKAEAALLTHGHYDHHGAVKEFQEAGVKIYMHAADERLITNGPRFSWALAFKPDYYVSDGGALDIAGLNIKVIHTPGHSEGGVCYLLDGLLFSGDTLFHGDVGRTDLSGGNFEKLKESILKKLYVLPDNTRVFPGHEEETTIGEEKRFNNYVRAEERE